MAVNLSVPEQLLPVAGFRLASTAAAIRYQGRNDLLVIELCEGATVAGVFTRNVFCAAPVTLAKRHLSATATRYLVINAGNANAGTGDAGMQAAQAVCGLVAEQGGCRTEAVLPFSTGIIGEQLPIEPFAKALPQAHAQLQEDAWLEAAHTIMTTDTLAKAVSKQIELDGKTVTLTGISKGSGMIRPDMATMLGYIATDAEVDKVLLQGLLDEVVQDSFNAITVDGDTSTNDALILMASGKSGAVVTEQNMAVFKAALLDVCLYLAHAIIRDGEGANKFISIEVTGAKDKTEAREIAFTVAHSPLVKTALSASDPNWGRILAAVGRAPVSGFNISDVSLWLGDVQLIQAGEPSPSYTEAQGKAETEKDEIDIRIDMGSGSAQATVWTCDLSHEYVSINADYRS